MALNDNTTLYGYGAPTINKVDAQRVLSNTILENVHQGLIENAEEGVTQRFSRDTRAASIRIPHFKPYGIEARQLGASINGGNFPNSIRESESQSFEVPVLFLLDEPIEVAEVSQDIATVNILSEAIKNWTRESTVQINAMTIAGKFFYTYKAKLDGKDINEVQVDANDYSASIMEANSLLDDGAPEIGVDQFPSDGRVCVIQNKYRAKLLKSGVLVLGGANLGYSIQEKGTLSAGATPRKLEDGFIGTIDGVPVHQTNSLTMQKASTWLGLGKDDFKNVMGYVSSAYANVRVIAAPYDVQIGQHPTGRGWLLKPLLRAGFKTIEGYEKGNVFLVEKAFKNPFEQLKKWEVTNIDFVPSKSRIKLDLSLTSSGSTKVTATVAKAGDVKDIYAIAGHSESVVDFASGIKLTSGTEGTIPAATTGKEVSVCAIAKDGTCTFGHIIVK